MWKFCANAKSPQSFHKVSIPGHQVKLWYFIQCVTSFVMINDREYGGLYHIETSPLTCTADQWTGFYMIGTSIWISISWLSVKAIEVELLSGPYFSVFCLNIDSKFRTNKEKYWPEKLRIWRLFIQCHPSHDS